LEDSLEVVKKLLRKPVDLIIPSMDYYLKELCKGKVNECKNVFQNWVDTEKNTLSSGRKEYFNFSRQINACFHLIGLIDNCLTVLLSIVLSETLLPPRTPYKWRFKEEVIGKENCKVFTLVARQLYPPGGLYIKSSIVEMLQNEQMKKTGEFQRLINYLQNL